MQGHLSLTEHILQTLVKRKKNTHIFQLFNKQAVHIQELSENVDKKKKRLLDRGQSVHLYLEIKVVHTDFRDSVGSPPPLDLHQTASKHTACLLTKHALWQFLNYVERLGFCTRGNNSLTIPSPHTHTKIISLIQGAKGIKNMFNRSSL